MFVSHPPNFAKFAAFVRSVDRRNGKWFLETGDGSMKIEFVPPNELGVLDHTVTLPSGAEVFNPMRVILNGTGSVVIFTTFQRPGMSDDEFSRDVKLVEADLKTLKAELEEKPSD